MYDRSKRKLKLECTGSCGVESDGAPGSNWVTMMVVVAESMAHLKKS